HILGKGQLSLAKFLFIIDKEDNPALDIHHIDEYLQHVLERVHWENDLHFYTNTSIDTLDYSGTSINRGSKLAIAAVGNKKRELRAELSSDVNFPSSITNAKVVQPGILAIQGPSHSSEEETNKLIDELTNHLGSNSEFANGFPLIVLCDDADFVSETLNNFLWVTFTRSNPADDVHGINSFIQNKHWGCKGSLIIDARKKAHHAPDLIKDPEVEKRVDALGAKGGSLHGII
ncbi:MAG: UbiD family decarboxylase, partial [Bacteroidia bacterium]|nr:UbiD family decarboxylase [Bacteroidia bacterium]